MNAKRASTLATALAAVLAILILGSCSSPPERDHPAGAAAVAGETGKGAPRPRPITQYTRPGRRPGGYGTP